MSHKCRLQAPPDMAFRALLTADPCSAAFPLINSSVAEMTSNFEAYSGEELRRGETVMRVNCVRNRRLAPGRHVMDGIIYIVGLIVIIMFILSFLGLH